MAYLSSLNNYRNTGLLILRVGLGAMMIFHGYPKLTGGTEMWAGLGSSTQYVGIHFWPVMWGFLAAITETLGGFLILIGFAFRPAAFFLMLNLVVAAATHLGKGDGLDGAAHAIELAFVFAGLTFVGPGKYSVDKK
ncbi:DoxX family protein [Mucilaginibacter sp. 14171R-50]|uniref:DoxX family protein n=1 Tax=Mucilaginibacter sp. 14171R-50 TaxID=2703789 RepID=UPI00138C326C|nr:DoxX family protein [Mucilaginibacter sp. 14171R-50]QHS54999.1 DoxX family protein [Mucilaginibacter sp. 14171R-50]